MILAKDLTKLAVALKYARPDGYGQSPDMTRTEIVLAETLARCDQWRYTVRAIANVCMSNPKFDHGRFLLTAGY
jgi:hypothetical protein